MHQVIINGVRHYVFTGFRRKDWKTMDHDLGFAFLSPSGSTGFLPFEGEKYLMFEVKEYEQSKQADR